MNHNTYMAVKGACCVPALTHILAPLARAYLLGALLLLGCSVPVHGAIEHLSGSVELHCGWVRMDEYPPEAACGLYKLSGGEGGVLPAGVDPCEQAPARELRVDAGEAVASWGRIGRTNDVTEEPCSAP